MSVAESAGPVIVCAKLDLDITSDLVVTLATSDDTGECETGSMTC